MGIFNFIKSAFSNTTAQPESQYEEVMRAAYAELFAKNFRDWWSLKASDVNVFAEKLMLLTDKQKKNFIISAIIEVDSFSKRNDRSYSYDNINYQRSQVANIFMRQLLRTKLLLDDEDIREIASAFFSYDMYGHNINILFWPISSFINQIEKQIKERGLSDHLNDTLVALLEKLEENNYAGTEKEKSKLLEKIKVVLFDNNKDNVGVKPTFFVGEDEFALYANTFLESLNEQEQQQWFKMMLQAQKASGAKPSKKYLDEFKLLFKEYGADKFKLHVNDWFVFLVSIKGRQVVDPFYHVLKYEFIESVNATTVKGFLWACVHFHDKTTLLNISKLAERTYKKIPGIGPVSTLLGNACVYVLANSKGLDGVGYLSRLRLRVTQSSLQNLIEKYLLEAAAAQGVSMHDIEDMAVDDHGLLNGKREYELEGYKAILEITAVGKTTLNWFKPDGSPQKTEPALIKDKHPAKLKKIKSTTKEVALSVSTQRDRLDRMFKSDRTMTGINFNEFYFSHGLMSFLAKKLIWIFEKNNNKKALYYLDGKWCDPKTEASEIILDENTRVSLWHPVFSTVDEIKAWREFMIQHKIVQPLKQAYREVYLLTDAEINTSTYSNRMAAHILKQQQFNSLANVRGWKYSVIGNFDNGGNQQATIDLKEYGLKASFWINEVAMENAMNDTGIWLYVATDQVRFADMVSNEVKALIDIPALLFSEIMRDTDLFVGVASVGNDPNWSDTGGLPGYRDYWQAYSFGDLTEVAKTRKSILEGLIPRLKIAHVSSLKDKFMIVKGKLRTYKIHLGSTNILMEPNDQYLCIVPDRAPKENKENIFLPFEGDAGLSIILSKAMLLANDDKITDTTITSQILKN
ncbi:MAG: DUF4132 domain-containing protein [Ferruginibacter sp.]